MRSSKYITAMVTAGVLASGCDGSPKIPRITETKFLDMIGGQASVDAANPDDVDFGYVCFTAREATSTAELLDGSVVSTGIPFSSGPDFHKPVMGQLVTVMKGQTALFAEEIRNLTTDDSFEIEYNGPYIYNGSGDNGDTDDIESSKLDTIQEWGLFSLEKGVSAAVELGNLSGFEVSLDTTHRIEFTTSEAYSAFMDQSAESVAQQMAETKAAELDGDQIWILSATSYSIQLELHESVDLSGRGRTPEGVFEANGEFLQETGAIRVINVMTFCGTPLD